MGSAPRTSDKRIALLKKMFGSRLLLVAVTTVLVLHAAEARPKHRGASNSFDLGKHLRGKFDAGLALKEGIIGTKLGLTKAVLGVKAGLASGVLNLKKNLLGAKLDLAGKVVRTKVGLTK